MANVRQLTGVKTVLANLKRKQAGIGNGVSRGLRLAGLFLQRESQKKVPVNFGVLKASAFTRRKGRGFGTQVTVGYTASYALFVHESVEMKLKGQPRTSGSAAYDAAVAEASRIGVPPPRHKPAGFQGHYWDPQGRAQAKFLEEPARTNRDKLRQIILQSAKL